MAPGKLALVVCAIACLSAAFGAAQPSAVMVTFHFLEAGLEHPVACRVHLKDAAGKAIRAPDLPFWKDHFVCAGEVTLPLVPGSYSYEVERGPEYRVTAGTLIVKTGPAQTVTNHLQRFVDLAKEGWWSGELHVHRPLAEIELLMRSEDLHIAPVITWWNTQNIWATKPLPANPLIHFDQDRYYQVMGGEDERGGGALLYFNLKEPLNISQAQREFPSPMKFLAAARSQGAVWVDIEKPFWYDAPVWLASGQVDSVGIAHNHMHRGGVMENEAWGRARDRQRYPGTQGNGFWTQDIYYHALNAGLRLPPSAGSASGVLPNPVGYDRLYVRLDGELTWEKWWEGLRAGRVFVSNGPLLRCRADGQWPGHIFQGQQPISLPLEATMDSRDPVSAIEIIKNGRVERTVPVAEWRRTGSLGRIAFQESGWFLVRALADVPGTFRFASTGPFYIEIGATPRRVSKSSAQFFLDWVRERMSQIKLDNPQERAEVLKPHATAEKFWQEKVAQANAE
jgi:hypothetical protein